MQTHFEQLAAYNRWANARLYEASLTLAEADYQRDTGVFFKSMSGTLNHLLVTDRNWMWRLTRHGLHYDKGDIVVIEDRRKLAAARACEVVRADERETICTLAADAIIALAQAGVTPEDIKRYALAHVLFMVMPKHDRTPVM